MCKLLGFALVLLSVLVGCEIGLGARNRAMPAYMPDGTMGYMMFGNVPLISSSKDAREYVTKEFERVCQGPIEIKRLVEKPSAAVTEFEAFAVCVQADRSSAK